MMIESTVRADIQLSNGRGWQRCHGPTWNGLCPGAAPDGRAPCAGGQVLPLRGTWADGARLAVRAGAGPECPLAGLVTVVPAPWD
jgi:hypothetical protein